jgi:predicted nuclease with TOPRIM domain
MKQIQYEQQSKIEKKKHKLELEARLRTAELEAQKSMEERQNLEGQIKDMKKTQSELLSKIRESQEFLDVCTSFLQKNGLLATSFISDDGF